tara:strand:+ start:338 stop:559 length:222 start_codon:yes stop_codon:yes gene_type:complete
MPIEINGPSVAEPLPSYEPKLCIGDECQLYDNIEPDESFELPLEPTLRRVEDGAVEFQIVALDFASFVELSFR